MDREKLIEELSLEQKKSLRCGADGSMRQVGELPALNFGRGGFFEGGNDLPSAFAIACSWDKDVAFGVGRERGLFSCAKKIHVSCDCPPLTPSKNPYGGTRAGSLSSDPILTEELALSYIDGLQSTGVGACPPIVPFGEKTSDEQAEFVCSVIERGRLSSKALLIDTAARAGGKSLGKRIKEAGFSGVTVSEWGTADGKRSGSGVDLFMPTCEEKNFPDKFLGNDDEVGRIIELIDECYDNHEFSVDEQASARQREQLALSCPVLLKNDGVLPLSGDSITVMGKTALSFPTAAEQGGEKREASLVKALKEDRRVKYMDGYGDDPSLVEEALQQTLPDETVIVVIGSTVPDCFGIKRDTRICESALTLIERLEESGREVITIAVGGGALDLKRASVSRALVYVPYLGSGGAAALKQLICGEASFCGRLAEDFCHIGKNGKNETVYPFGYGLSYAEFTYENAEEKDGEVCVTVKNDGRFPASETIAVYSPIGEKYRLVAFEKVRIRVGETRKVVLKLPGKIAGKLFVGRDSATMISEVKRAGEETPTDNAADNCLFKPIEEESRGDDEEKNPPPAKLLARLKKSALLRTNGDVARAERLALGAATLPIDKLVILSQGQIKKNDGDTKFSSGGVGKRNTTCGKRAKH